MHLLSGEEKQAQLFQKFAHNDVIKEEEELVTISSRASPMFQGARNRPLFSSSTKTIFKVTTTRQTDLSDDKNRSKDKIICHLESH